MLDKRGSNGHAEKKEGQENTMATGNTRRLHARHRQRLARAARNEVGLADLAGRDRNGMRRDPEADGGGQAWRRQIDAFLKSRDPARLEALIHEHGPLVLGDPEVLRVVWQWWVLAWCAAQRFPPVGFTDQDVQAARSAIACVGKALVPCGRVGRHLTKPVADQTAIRAEFDAIMWLVTGFRRCWRVKGYWVGTAELRAAASDDLRALLRGVTIDGPAPDLFKDTPRTIALAFLAARYKTSAKQVRLHLEGHRWSRQSPTFL